MNRAIGELLWTLLLGGGIYLAAWTADLPIRTLCRGYIPRYITPSLQMRVRPIGRIGIPLRFLADALIAVSVGIAVSIFDCGILGGTMRLHHFFALLLGVLFVRRLMRSRLLLPLRVLLATAGELALLLASLAILPIRTVFASLFDIGRRILLIWSIKYAKIKEKRIARRYTARMLELSRSAFLPPTVEQEILCRAETAERKEA